jgi:hypothetical protein
MPQMHEQRLPANISPCQSQAEAGGPVVEVGRKREGGVPAGTLAVVAPPRELQRARARCGRHSCHRVSCTFGWWSRDAHLAAPQAAQCASLALAPSEPLDAPPDSPRVRWGTRAVLRGSRETASRPPSGPAATLDAADQARHQYQSDPGDQRSRVAKKRLQPCATIWPSRYL